MAGYRRNGGNGGRSAAPAKERQGAKNPPCFTRKLWTPSGLLEVAVFEKRVQGNGKSYTTFFVVPSRSYPDPDKKGEYITTHVLNPQDLLMMGDMLKIAWDFILEECNRE